MPDETASVETEQMARMTLAIRGCYLEKMSAPLIPHRLLTRLQHGHANLPASALVSKDGKTFDESQCVFIESQELKVAHMDAELAADGLLREHQATSNSQKCSSVYHSSGELENSPDQLYDRFKQTG